MASMFAAWACCLLAVLALHRPAAADLLNSRNKGDLVTAIPGYSKPLKHYAGFVGVGGAKPTGRIYYYLATAPNPETAPLILWMHNAPECSSMLALVYEHGPFRLQSNDKTGKSMAVGDNPHSWNKFANVIYVDLPAGNGWSTAKVPAWAPDSTAGQLVQFMKGFYARYPALKKVPLFLGGQTVGVSTMLLSAQRLQREMKDSPLRGYIAISGQANDCRFDEGARVKQILKAKLMPAADVAEYKAFCKEGPCTPSCQFNIDGLIINKQKTAFNHYGVTCQERPFPMGGRRLSDAALATTASIAASQMPLPEAEEAGEGLRGSARGLQQTKKRPMGGSMTCGDYSAATAFFTLAAVRKALHIPAFDPANPATAFGACRSKQLKMMSRNPRSTAAFKFPLVPILPLHRNLIRKRGLRGLIMHGYNDLQQPWMGGRMIAAGVGLPRTRSAVAVKLQGRKVAVVEGYGKGPGRELSFAVVDRAGTFVSQDQPAAVQHIVKRFIVRRNIES